MAQIEVKVKLDLPVGVELLGYERCGDGHGFEVKFPLPLDLPLREVRHEATGQLRGTRTPSTWCATWICGASRASSSSSPASIAARTAGTARNTSRRSNGRRSCTPTALRNTCCGSLIGSNEEEVAARLGISAETVALIVENQLKDDKKIDPAAGDQARGDGRNQPQEAAQAVRDGDDRSDRPELAEGAGGGARPRHGGGRAVPGETDARAA